MKLINNIYILLVALVLSLAGCAKEDVSEKKFPTADDIEIGGDHGTGEGKNLGYIGKDLHFNARIVAGDKIETVIIKIVPIPGETYTAPWAYTIEWTEYNGLKNTTVHKHFDIPTTAIAGKYNFFIIVKDQNGATLEVKRTITLLPKG